MLIPNKFFEYIYHIGCAISLQSITNSGLIAGGQNSSRERQTVFFTAVNPMNKDHRDPQELDLTKPRLASYKQRIESVNQDNSHSCVRICHGLNKCVMDLSNQEYDDNEQETSETKTEVFAFASRSKAKAKPRRPTSACSSATTVSIRERLWIDI